MLHVIFIIIQVYGKDRRGEGESGKVIMRKRNETGRVKDGGGMCEWIRN